MKPTATALLLFSAFASGAFALSGVEIPQKDLAPLKAQASVFLKTNNFYIKKAQKVDEVSQLEISVPTPQGSQTVELFFVDNIPDKVFAGSVYKKTKTDVERLAFKLNTDLIKKGVATVIGSGTEDIYIVTDPECPYCQRLEKSMSENAYSKYRINIIPMPLSFHKNAVAMLYWIFQNDNPNEIKVRMKQIADQNTEYQKFNPTKELREKVDLMIKNGYSAAEELKAQGTPSVYDKDFTPIQDFSILMK